MSVRKLYLQQRITVLAVICFVVSAFMHSDATRHATITGKAAFADYTQEKPGTFRKITVADLPAPHATESVDNMPDVIPRPSSAWPQALPGFKVELYASGLNYPRLIRTAPNGDLFLAESHLGRDQDFSRNYARRQGAAD